MTKEAFFEGFVAALARLNGEAILTAEDAHHEAFTAALGPLEDARRQGVDAADTLPRVFRASLFTGRYAELDEALAKLQRVGLLRGINPFYRRLEIALDRDSASLLLDRFSEAQGVILATMARAFLDVQRAHDSDRESDFALT